MLHRGARVQAYSQETINSLLTTRMSFSIMLEKLVGLGEEALNTLANQELKSNDLTAWIEVYELSTGDHFYSRMTALEKMQWDAKENSKAISWNFNAMKFIDALEGLIESGDTRALKEAENLIYWQYKRGVQGAPSKGPIGLMFAKKEPGREIPNLVDLFELYHQKYGLRA